MGTVTHSMYVMTPMLLRRREEREGEPSRGSEDSFRGGEKKHLTTCLPPGPVAHSSLFLEL